MKKISVLAIAAVLSTPVFAADTGMYGVVSFGQSDADAGSKSSLDGAIVAATGATGLTSSLDDKDDAYKILVGYQVNKNFAIEAGYVDLGSIKYKASANEGNGSVGIDATGWNIALLGILPVNDAFSIFGKIGTINARVEPTVKLNIPTIGTFSESDSETNWRGNYGGGASYRFNNYISGRVEYERFRNLGDSNESDVDLISMGLVIHY